MIRRRERDQETTHEVFLGLGSNIGDRRAFLIQALQRLASAGVKLKEASSLYETDPMDYTRQPRFLNAVIRAETALPPEDLLRSIKEIERTIGRQKRFRYGPREIDIDILFYDHLEHQSNQLTIPHPRIEGRPFVGVPLRELRGHPAVGIQPGIERLEGPDWASVEKSAQ